MQAPTLARKRNISNWFPCGADGWVGGRAGGWTYGHVTDKFFEWIGNHIFLALRLRARMELRFDSVSMLWRIFCCWRVSMANGHR